VSKRKKRAFTALSGPFLKEATIHIRRESMDFSDCNNRHLWVERPQVESFVRVWQCLVCDETVSWDPDTTPLADFTTETGLSPDPLHTVKWKGFWSLIETGDNGTYKASINTTPATFHGYGKSREEALDQAERRVRACFQTCLEAGGSSLIANDYLTGGV
jgi:hypothetical protein